MTNTYQPSTFFFPLRSNVKYFDSPDAQLALVDRVKEAALLYDSLLFEGGMYHAVIWDDNAGHGRSYDMWIPPEDLRDDDLRRDETEFRPSGGEAAVLIDGHVFANAEPERRFRSEFHSLLSKLNAKNLPWLRIDTFHPSGEIKSAASRVAMEDETLLADLFPVESRFLKSKILNNLNLDLMLIAQLECAASVDSLFEPLLRKKALNGVDLQPAPAFSAFRIAVPNVAQIPWDEIVDLREQECLKELRRKMVEVEHLARIAMTSAEVEDWNLKISQIINDELLRETEKWLPKPIGVLGDVTCDLICGLIPGLSPVVTAATGAGEVLRARESWITALLKLRQPTNRLGS